MYTNMCYCITNKFNIVVYFMSREFDLNQE